VKSVVSSSLLCHSLLMHKNTPYHKVLNQCGKEIPTKG
jgi:hypothetical protein